MDFDGDAMTMMFMLDNYMSQAIEPLSPHKNMVDPNHPRTLTGVASMPKPVASSIINWLAGYDRTFDLDDKQQAFRQRLLEKAAQRDTMNAAA